MIITKEEFLKMDDLSKLEYSIKESLKDHANYSNEFWKGSAHGLNNVLDSIKQIRDYKNGN